MVSTSDQECLQLSSSEGKSTLQQTSVDTAIISDPGSIPGASIAYIAGLIDADGTITIAKSRKNSFCPQVYITNTCRPLIDWCDKIVPLPNTICQKRKKRDNHNDAWEIRWSYNASLAVIDLVKPYLIVKLPQAVCVERWPLVVKRNGKYTIDELHARDQLVNEIRSLNKRG